jgi:hypothetical protein
MITEQQVTNRIKWITALRSGKYKQGIPGRLKEVTGYCCLGVACAISGTEKWDDITGAFSTDGLEAFNYQLPDYDWMSCVFGIDAYDISRLARMNDGKSLEDSRESCKRSSFEEIADALEFITLADTEAAG